MEELPTKLKLELALIMINRMYANITFFRNKEKSFIAWIARLIRPINVDHEDYIYKEGEEIAESKKFVLTCAVYFINKGQVNYVLPRFSNKTYHHIR